MKENEMKLKKLPYDFTVCQAASAEDIDLNNEFCFAAKTDEEMSLVCKTADAPANTTARDDGWKGFRIQGVLDFSLIGILSKISNILAENGIAVFAVSSFNTDYIFVKAGNFDKAMDALADAGYTVE